jgi:hypothetical protein
MRIRKRGSGRGRKRRRRRRRRKKRGRRKRGEGGKREEELLVGEGRVGEVGWEMDLGEEGKKLWTNDRKRDIVLNGEKKM